MNVPKLRFKEFNDEWKENKLHDIAKITMGQSPNSENYTYDSSDTLLIQGNADLYNGKVIPRLFTKQITKTCDKEDIIMTVRAPVGDIAISDYYACIGRGVCSIKSSKFIYHYLDYLKEKGYWKKISKGSTIDSITSDNIKSLVIKTPSRKEQEKVIRTIDLINKKIELQTKKIEALKLFKKGLLKCEYNKIKSKNLSQLNNVAQIYQPRTLSQKQLKKGVYPVFGANGIIGFNSNFNHKLPQITISCRGENSGSINKTPEYCWINGNSMVINVDNNPNINKDYLKLILESQNLKYLISGSGQPQIIRSDIAKHKIPIISIDEQLIYIKKFNLLESKLPLEISKLKKLNLLKKGLMQNMFI